MPISSIGGASGLTSNILQLQERLESLQVQLATGKRSQTYGGLGSDRVVALSLRARVSEISGFQDTIQLAQTRLSGIQTNLDRFGAIAREARTESLNDPYELLAGNQTRAQLNAAFRLDEAVALLNLDLAGSHPFGGTDTATPPVRVPDAILNGAGGRAGLIQVIDERRQADLGVDGRGRLDIGPAVGASVSLTEDGTHPFGIKLVGINNSLSGTSVTQPAGSPPALDVTFSGTLPQPGETVQITVALPDGTEDVIELTAANASPPGVGAFTIGADQNATAANFETALGAAVETLAATSLQAASALEAANNFFDYDSANRPQRVDGPPFGTATALIDGTTANTTFYYTGENGPGPARDTAIARIDDGLKLGYGVRANEEPLRTTIKALATLTAVKFDPADANGADRYRALSSRLAQALDFPGTNKSVDDLIGELGFRQRSLDDANARHTTAATFSQGLLDETEGADTAEIGVELVSLQTRLQASFQTVSTISRLSLVNFLPR